jgi:hypothetical protein
VVFIYDFDQIKIVEIHGPRPDSWNVVRLCFHMHWDYKKSLPSTIIKATRYGKGRKRLKESSSGSTEGSPSMKDFHRRLESQQEGSGEKINISCERETMVRAE